jgi:hypothetical protein
MEMVKLLAAGLVHREKVYTFPWQRYICTKLFAVMGVVKVDGQTAQLLVTGVP